jgi:hypothetical protein
MREIVTVSALLLAGFGLSGCAVVEVGGAVASVAGSVVSTTVDVAGDIITAPFPSHDSGDDKKKD